LGEDDPEKVLPLYASDAVLWGTLSPKLLSDPAALRDYFVTAFNVLPSLKVIFGDQLIRVYGNTAINTGYYTFSYMQQNGESKTFPARYSFTFVKSGDRWLIADHHSSAMPPPPKITVPRRWPSACLRYRAEGANSANQLKTDSAIAHTRVSENFVGPLLPPAKPGRRRHPAARRMLEALSSPAPAKNQDSRTC
jgi:uncharacterized protein (TIGR02246 family)